jgi:hypothetical protein
MGDKSRRFMKHLLFAFLAGHAVIFPLSGYRAWVQIRDVKLAVETDSARATIETSGRIPIDVSIELIQGDHEKLLDAQTIPSNREAIYDPRPRRATIVIPLTRGATSGFDDGPASIKVTARGRQQFTRMPPPVIREAGFTISTESIPRV